MAAMKDIATVKPGQRVREFAETAAILRRVSTHKNIKPRANGEANTQEIDTGLPEEHVLTLQHAVARRCWNSRASEDGTYTPE